MIKLVINALRKLYQLYVLPQKDIYGRKGLRSKVEIPALVIGYENIFLEENVTIGPFSVIFAPHSTVRIKKYSYSGPRLFISTGNHCFSKIGRFSQTIEFSEYDVEDNPSRDVTIEEDVWIGANVSILCKKIGRGSIVAAGSVVKNDVLPYTIVGGVPAKPLKLRFTKNEIIAHEKELYADDERLSDADIDIIINSIKR